MELPISHQQMNLSVLPLFHYTVIISEDAYRNGPQSYNVNHMHSHTHTQKVTHTHTVKNEALFFRKESKQGLFFCRVI